MPPDPITYNGGKLAHLQIEGAVIPGRKTKRIFIEAHLSAASCRIKPAIDPRLRKEINMRTVLRVEKERQAWIKEVIGSAVDESWRRLLEMIRFKIDCAA